MIFVTLGTQDKKFTRLLNEIDKMIDDKIIDEPVMVQAGFTGYKSKNMEILEYMPIDQFDNYVKECKLLITHGGVGSILTGCLEHKKIIAVARRKMFDEHENDHQLQIVSDFNERGYILGCMDAKKLREVYLKINNFTPNKFVANNECFCDLIKKSIDNF